MKVGIRGFLFDKDGTLVDAFPGWIALNRRLFEELRARYPHPRTTGDLEALLGIAQDRPVPGGPLASGTSEQIYRAHHRLLGEHGPPWDRFLPEITRATTDLFEESPPTATPLGRVRETLELLRHRGYRLGVATSDLYANATRDLAAHGGEAIEFWASADRVTHPKPDPESVLRFASAVGLTPGDVAFVGDSDVDLACARAAGVGVFIAVASATCPPGVLEAADVVVNSIDDIPGRLGVEGPGPRG